MTQEPYIPTNIFIPTKLNGGLKEEWLELPSSKGNHVEYIRKDIHDKAMNTADEAFHEACEKIRQQIIDNACDYLFAHMTLIVSFYDEDILEYIDRSEFIKKFRKHMEE